ncbi:SCO2583 family membrane protein [Streptomyces sp. LE64]|uniref:SCO2583 family membrane protein n=1 Tax=Streptomyces sp. LE64 TaxID=3448653 RepID=UPI004041FA9E
MGGPGNPPQGTPEGAPGDDEYRSVVFDESFVRAARLQEFSAEERITDHTPAVRRAPPPRRRGTSWQALTLVVTIAVAFVTAVYLGFRQPAERYPGQRAAPLRMTVIPLAPVATVPGGSPAELYARSPADQFRIGAKGIALPLRSRTAHFSVGQVEAALVIAKEYLVRSSVDPEVLTGDAVRPVRVLIDSDQYAQFDRSVERPAADGLHSATGWLVRFDPARVALAEPRVRVEGTLRVSEADSGTLEVTSDHTFVYALRPARGGTTRAALFTVRRALLFRFDREDLRQHRAEVVTSYTQAGPLACAARWADRLRPLLAGSPPAGGPPRATDPYAADGASHPCGTLAPGAQPQATRAG